LRDSLVDGAAAFVDLSSIGGDPRPRAWPEIPPNSRSTANI